MSKYYSEEELDRIARKRVKTKKGFYIHLQVYVVVNAFLFIITTLEEGTLFASYPAALSWGVGLAIHYLVVFGFPGIDGSSSEWEMREYEKERDKLAQNQPRRLPEERHDNLDLDEIDQRLNREEYRPNYDKQDLV